MEHLQYDLHSAGLTHNIRRGGRTSARTLHSRSVFLLVPNYSAKQQWRCMLAGFLVRRVEQTGALTGLLTGLVLLCWIGRSRPQLK
jgi:hypothetical protein